MNHSQTPKKERSGPLGQVLLHFWGLFALIKNSWIKERESGGFVFFGTDELAVGVLAELATAGLCPAVVITAPDRPAGRKMILTPPPVKVWAENKNIPVLQPEKLNNEFVEILKKYDAQVFIVASYGKIIPKKIIDLPTHGVLNVHPSLLPLHRGATPLESAILSGDTETGVAIMQIDEEMDHGPILAMEKITLTGNEYYPELRDKLAKIGGALLAQTIPLWLSGKITPTEQDHSKATYTKKITKEDGLVKLSDPAQEIYRKLRAFDPWPGVYFFAQKNGEELRVIIKQARLENGQLIIEKVLPAGRKEMTWNEFEKFTTAEETRT